MKEKENSVCLALFGLRLKQSAQTVESFELAVFRQGEEEKEKSDPSFVDSTFCWAPVSLLKG